eukprot:5713176-Amphidinium_carterae.1
MEMTWCNEKAAVRLSNKESRKAEVNRMLHALADKAEMDRSSLAQLTGKLQFCRGFTVGSCIQPALSVCRDLAAREGKLTLSPEERNILRATGEYM